MVTRVVGQGFVGTENPSTQLRTVHVCSNINSNSQLNQCVSYGAGIEGRPFTLAIRVTHRSERPSVAIESNGSSKEAPPLDGFVVSLTTVSPPDVGPLLVNGTTIIPSLAKAARRAGHPPVVIIERT